MNRNGADRNRARWAAAIVTLSLTAPLVAHVGPVHAEGTTLLSVGSNADGQLGDGTNAARLTAGAVGLTNVVQVASGREHAYALDDQGRLWAWGDNSRGQLGDGTVVDRPNPVLVMTDVRHFAAGDYHGIAEGASSTLWTWGDGASGQLGLGTTASHNVPTQVPGFSEILQVAAGRDTSYVLMEDSTLHAFGGNTFGQIGDGTTVPRLSPVMLDVFGIDAIAAGANHAILQEGDGSLWAWGDNRFGQLGDGTKVRRTTPTQVLPIARSFDAGADHSVAVLPDGTVRTWGRGYRGQLGLGNTATKLKPQKVPGLSGVVDIGVGRDQSFAIGGTGQVWAWGFNDNGQLGDGTRAQRNSPVRLNGLPQIGRVDSGRAMTFFLPTATPPSLASVDFSNGLAGFTGVSGMVVDSSIGSASGPPSARIATTNQVGSAELPFASSAGVCASVDVRIASMSTTVAFPLLTLVSTSGQNLAKLQRNTSGGLTARIGNLSVTTGTKLPLNTWHHLTLCVDVGTLGQVRWALNGTDLGTQQADLGTAPIGAVRLGEPFARTATVNWDDLLVLPGA